MIMFIEKLFGKGDFGKKREQPTAQPAIPTPSLSKSVFEQDIQQIETEEDMKRRLSKENESRKGAQRDIKKLSNHL